jgi:hypothetical protein
VPRHRAGGVTLQDNPLGSGEVFLRWRKKNNKEPKPKKKVIRRWCC